jgi:hypothetical protein
MRQFAESGRSAGCGHKRQFETTLAEFGKACRVQTLESGDEDDDDAEAI